MGECLDHHCGAHGFRCEVSGELGAWFTELHAFDRDGADPETLAHERVEVDTAGNNVAADIGPGDFESGGLREVLDLFLFDQRQLIGLISGISTKMAITLDALAANQRRAGTILHWGTGCRCGENMGHCSRHGRVSLVYHLTLIRAPL